MPDQIILDALDRFKQSDNGSSHNRNAAREDVEFARLGKQWPDDVATTRLNEGRPMLTINRLPSFVRQVVNDARQNSPQIQVVPVDNGADVDTATVIGGLIRSIERGSNAAVAYDTALEHAVDRGFGFFRISTDYCHADSFDMEARIERVANPFSVHWDASSTEFDASDWGYAFVSDLLTDAEFKLKYPKAKPVSWHEAAAEVGNYWSDEERIRVAEYWLRTEIKRKIILLSNGAVVRADDFKKPLMLPDGSTVEAVAAYEMQGITPIREREATDHTVKRRVISPVEVLEEADWPGSMIPICPVWGEEVIHMGKRHFRSLVRDARDPQRMFNFWRSATTELVALAPRAPWLVQEGSIPPMEANKWNSANTRSHAYLQFRGDMTPQRQPFASVPAGALQEALNASDDMKSIMGIYDASLGAKSNETSGRAIMARQREGDVGTFHFIDNLSRAIQYAGRVLVEIIPSIYSQREAVQILGPDMAPKVAKLTAESGTPAVQNGEGGKLYNISVGKYDVAVKTGPSFSTQREETREALTSLAQAAGPQGALLFGDQIIQNMDFPGSEIMARRLKAMLPPQVRAAEEDGGDGMPPEAKMQISQMQQQNAGLQQQLQQMGGELQSKQGEQQAKQGELQIKAQEVAIKRDELALKARELALKEFEAQARVQMDMQARAMEGHAKSEKSGEGEAAQNQENQMLQGIAQMQMDMMGALQQLTRIVSAPRKSMLLRDEQGRVSGGHSVIDMEAGETL
jgi:hypothetical protein